MINMLIELNFGEFIKGLCSIKTTDENINNYIHGQLYNEFRIQGTAGQWYSYQRPR